MTLKPLDPNNYILCAHKFFFRSRKKNSCILPFNRSKERLLLSSSPLSAASNGAVDRDSLVFTWSAMPKIVETLEVEMYFYKGGGPKTSK